MIASIGFRRLALIGLTLLLAVVALAAPWAPQYSAAKWVAAICVAAIVAALVFSFLGDMKRFRTRRGSLVVVGSVLLVTIGANLIDLPRTLFAGGNYPVKRNASMHLVDLAHNDPQLQIRTEAYALYWLRQYLEGADVIVDKEVVIVPDRWRQYAHVANARPAGDGEAPADRIDPSTRFAADLGWAKDVTLEVHLAAEPADQYFLRHKPDEAGVMQLLPLLPERDQS